MKGSGYSGFSSDVWSSGVVLFILLYGTVPFKAGCIDELNGMIINGEYKLKDNISAEARSLISNILKLNPSHRLKLDEILNHCWMKNNDGCVFTQKEKDALHSDMNEIKDEEYKELCYENDMQSELRNNSSKSNLLAPYNSTKCNESLSTKIVEDKEMIKFAPFVKDYDLQYMKNNNSCVENGIYNKLMCDSSEVSSLVSIEEESIIRNMQTESSPKQATRCSQAIIEIVASYGFKQEYIIDSIKKGECNHATASYYMLLLSQT